MRTPSRPESRESPPAGHSPSPLSWQELSTIQVKPILLYRGCLTHLYQAHVTPAVHAWWFLQEGHITVEIDGRVSHVRPGEWALLPTGGKRYQKFEPGSVYTSVNFLATWQNGIPLLHLPHPIIQRVNALPKQPEPLTALAHDLCLLLEHGSGPGNVSLRQRKLDIPDYIKSQAILYSFVEKLIRESLHHGATLLHRNKGDSRLELVLATLRHSPQAGPLPFEQWKETTGLGRSQIDRLARRTLGMSLHQFRDSQLLIEARKRLTTDAIIKQISKELGFVDTAHFCRWIRRHTGHTPQQLKVLQV